MSPFDTSAALAAHARQPAGRQHYLLTDDEATRDEDWRDREAMGRWQWHQELRRQRAASLGITVTQMRRMGGYEKARKALGLAR